MKTNYKSLQVCGMYTLIIIIIIIIVSLLTKDKSTYLLLHYTQ